MQWQTVEDAKAKGWVEDSPAASGVAASHRTYTVARRVRCAFHGYYWLGEINGDVQNTLSWPRLEPFKSGCHCRKRNLHLSSNLFDVVAQIKR